MTVDSLAKYPKGMLTEFQRKFYFDNGYIVLDDVYSTSEIDECSSEYDRVFELKKDSDLEATWKGNWTKDTASVILVLLIFKNCNY